MNKNLRILTVALGMVAVSTVACSRYHKSKTSNAPESNEARLHSVFSKGDTTYNVKDHNLTNKIEGISIDTLGGVARGLVQGQILLKGKNLPYTWYSEAVTFDILKTGNPVAISVQLPPDNIVSEMPEALELTGSFQCLNKDCTEAAVYFKYYQGAGYIFKKVGDKFKLTNTVGKTLGMEAALERRAVENAKLADAATK